MSQDSQLQQSVLAEFNWEPSVTAGHIGVTANAGTSGHVTGSCGRDPAMWIELAVGEAIAAAAKHAAEMAAGRVKGVKAVAEEIEVRLPFETQRSDEAIAAAAPSRTTSLSFDTSARVRRLPFERLAWNVSVPKDSVKVKVARRAGSR